MTQKYINKTKTFAFNQTKTKNTSKQRSEYGKKSLKRATEPKSQCAYY